MTPSKLMERGQALVLIALSAVVLFGFAALAIDGSAKFSDRRHAQNAADTAANAAALAKVNALLDPTKSNTPTTCPPPSGSPSAVCADLLLAGLERAISNGFGDNLSKSTVEIYSPPKSGYYSTVVNKDKYVQVIITSKVKTTFARILGINETVNIVQAVSFAEPGGKIANGAAIVSLDPNPNCGGGNGNGGGSVDLGGNGTINLTGGGIFVNSSASCGYSQTSCSVTLNIVGGGINSAGSNIYMQDKLNGNTCNTTGITTNSNNLQVVIPEEVYMPDRPAACDTAGSYTYDKKKNIYTLNPGYYTDFPPKAVSNTDDVILTSTTANHVYCLKNGFHWTGGGYKSITSTGVGVTLYITSGNTFDISGGNVTLTAPIIKNDPYNGFLVILEGDKDHIQSYCTINGNGTTTITGTIFAPYCNVTVDGGSNADAFGAQIIGWDVKLTGSTTINFTYEPGKNAIIKRKVGLMK